MYRHGMAWLPVAKSGSRERRSVEYKFTIPGRLSGLNEYTAANRSSPYKGGKMKKRERDIGSLVNRTATKRGTNRTSSCD